MSAKSLFEIVLIQIHSRNFYQAQYELQRANHFGVYDGELGGKFAKYKKFVGAVILMMKRKIESATSALLEMESDFGSGPHS